MEQVVIKELFRQNIYSENIMKDLLEQGFTIAHTEPGLWVMEQPADISSTKARKIASTCIKLYVAAKELSRANNKYLKLIDQINDLNMTR